MLDLTDAQLDELFDRSKNDKAIIVGSEVRQLIGMIRRLAAKPADEGMLTALKDARFYVEDAAKRSHHAYDQAVLEQIDDAIRALSAPGEQKS